MRKYLNKIKKIKEQLKRARFYGNTFYKIVCLLFKKLGYSNDVLLFLEVRNKVSNYVRKKYYRNLELTHYIDEKCEDNNEDVWICWLQGMENAPAIVQKCFESVNYWLSDKTIHLITEDNLFTYITVPQYIYTRWKKGEISNAHFSDAVRLELLIKYGGIWIDATVLMSGKIPNYIENAPFFIFQTEKSDITKAGENWFIKSNRNNCILLATRQLYYEFLKNEAKIKDYFITFIMMTMAIEKYPNEWNRMPKIPNAISLMLGNALLDKFDEKYWNEIHRLSTIHKLTYKLDTAENIGDTYYEHIINESII